MAALDAVDRERRGEHCRALDVGRLAEVGGGAEVLDRRRQFQHRLGALQREFGLRFRRGLAAELLDRAGQRGDVFGLLVAELFDRRQVGALEEAALDDVGVEGRLQVLERERVVEDADVALAELFGFAGSPAAAAVVVVVVVPLSLPQAARKAASAVEPPVSAMNLRRETGSLATRDSALSLFATAIASSSVADWFCPTRPPRAGSATVGSATSRGAGGARRASRRGCGPARGRCGRRPRRSAPAGRWRRRGGGCSRRPRS